MRLKQPPKGRTVILENLKAAIESAANGDFSKAEELLKELGPEKAKRLLRKVEFGSSFGSGFLYQAVLHQNLPAVEILIELGVNPLSRINAENETIAHFAARTGDLKLMQALKLKTANAVTDKGKNVMYCALENPSWKNAHEIVKFLAKPEHLNADLDKDGNKLMHIAASRGLSSEIIGLSSEMIACLIPTDGINTTNRNGDSVLHIIAKMEQKMEKKIFYPMDAFLLIKNLVEKHGAILGLKNNEGKKAVDYLEHYVDPRTRKQVIKNELDALEAKSNSSLQTRKRQGTEMTIITSLEGPCSSKKHKSAA